MSHASTASIVLGGQPSTPVGHIGGSGGGSSIMEPFGHPRSQSADMTSRQQAQQNRNRRRRRENVPEHMKHTVVAPVPRSSAPGEMGTVYTAKPTANYQSTTPAQAEQTQSLFKKDPLVVQNQPQYHVQQPSNIRYGMSQPGQQQQYRDSPQPAPQVIETESDVRRAEEARQKLKQMNLSAEIIAQYRRKFTVLDLNKDGVVNIREFAAISRVLGYKFSKEEVLEIFGRRDLDDSGGISFDEFVIAMYERAQKAKQLAPYREKFRLYDWRGKGYITTDEAYPILKKELGFDENKTETLIDMYDRNKDYRLSLLEFIEFYKKIEELKVQIHTAFHDFDRNNDGFVDSNEAKAVLLPKGFTEQQVDALIFKYDADADGMLNFQEFAKFWDVKLV